MKLLFALPKQMKMPTAVFTQLNATVYAVAMCTYLSLA